MSELDRARALPVPQHFQARGMNADKIILTDLPDEVRNEVINILRVPCHKSKLTRFEQAAAIVKLHRGDYGIPTNADNGIIGDRFVASADAEQLAALHIYSGTSFHEKPRRWLIPGMIERGVTTLISGAEGRKINRVGVTGCAAVQAGKHSPGRFRKQAGKADFNVPP